MEYRRLGRSGLMVSAVSMGTFSFGGRGDFAMVASQGVKEAQRLVDTCIEGGINLFDTANMYSAGRSEEILGEVIEGRRDKILISSKARTPSGKSPSHRAVTVPFFMSGISKP